MKTIQMTIDEGLLKAMDKMARATRTTRSAFIREALEAKLRRDQLRHEETRHAQGYIDKPVTPEEFGILATEQDWRGSY